MHRHIFQKSIPFFPLLVILALVFSFSVTGCDSKEKKDSKGNAAKKNAVGETEIAQSPPLSLQNKSVTEGIQQTIASSSKPPGKELRQDKETQTAFSRSKTLPVFRPEDDPYRLAEELQDTLQKSGANKPEDLQLLGQRAIKISTDLALELLAQLSSSSEREAFLKGVLSELFSVSPEEAVAWTEKNIAGDMKAAAFGLIGELYAIRNPVEAAAWAQQVENPVLRLRAYESIARVWGANDLNSAYDWALLIEDYGEQSKVFLRLGEAFSIENPPAAADWALSFEDKDLGNRILAMALNKWAMGGLPEAAQWSAELPEGMNKAFAVSQIGSIWAQLDPPTSFEWAYAMPDGEARDLALNTITYLWGQNNPKTAADRALEIEDDSLRLKTLDKILTIWLGKEPHSPARWAEMIRDPKARREAEQLLQQ